MDMLQLIVMIMVGTILATIVLAVLSYGAFRIRERRMPVSDLESVTGGPAFFERVRFLPTRAAESES